MNRRPPGRPYFWRCVATLGAVCAVFASSGRLQPASGSQPQPLATQLHIEEAMAGANGNSRVQYLVIERESSFQHCWGPQVDEATTPGADSNDGDCFLGGVNETQSRTMLMFFDASGRETGVFKFPENAPDGPSLTTLIATPEFAALPGAPVPDFIMPPLLNPVDGMVCFRSNPANPNTFFSINKCLAYGAFTGSAPNGPPAVALPIVDTQALHEFVGEPHRESNEEDYALLTNPQPRNTAGATFTFPMVTTALQGLNLFTLETFAGNGRTCASCHQSGGAVGLRPADVQGRFGKVVGTYDPLFIAETAPSPFDAGFDFNLNTLTLTAAVATAAPCSGDLRGVITSPILGSPASFFNSASISIPFEGVASPFPSTLFVPSTAPIGKITVTLHGFDHSNSRDVDVALVGPGGQSVMLLSDVGNGAPAFNATLTLDDAGTALNSFSTLTSGTYQPANISDFQGTDTFPGPVGPLGSQLSVFNGTNPNGVWQLLVRDDSSSNDGDITGGWSLTISPSLTPARAKVLSRTSPTTYLVHGGRSPMLSGVVSDANGCSATVQSITAGSLGANVTPGNTGLTDPLRLRRSASGAFPQGRALLLENVDGFAPPVSQHVFRKAPHLLNLSRTGPFGLGHDVPALSTFIERAITQHLPRTMVRSHTGGNPDFRLPTIEEAQALEAYLVAQEYPPGTDPDKFNLDRFATTAAQRRGRAAFFGSGAKCSQCHGGPVLAQQTVALLGQSAGVNGAFNTGVSSQAINTAIDNLPCERDPVLLQCGTRRFSVPQLFNVKGLGPYFHDASVPTLRQAVEFYDSPEFDFSPAGIALGGVTFAPGDVDDITAFLEGLVVRPFVLSAAALGFGTRADTAGPSSPQSVTITNNSASTITLSAPACRITGPHAAEFTIVNCSSGDLAPKASRIIEVVFDPSSGGAKSAILEINAADPSGVELSGLGIVNTLPTITQVFNTQMAEDSPTFFNFTVGDVETPPASLTLSAASTNQIVIPNSGLVISGSGAGRTLNVTPALNQFGSTNITVTAVDADGGTASMGFSINVTPMPDVPGVTNATTNEDTLSSSGLVISRNPADGAEVTHFKISGITGGALFQSDGVTAIGNGGFITFAQGNAGLRFKPALNSVATGHFTVKSSVAGDDTGLGVGSVTANIAVNPLLDFIAVTSTLDAVDANPGDGICAAAGGACTLRAAIQETNALNGNDWIDLPPGTFTLTIPGADEFAAATGDLNMLHGTVVTGASAATTIIDGNGLDRVFQGPRMTLRDLTVQHGAAAHGGCIFGAQSLSLLRVRVRECTAEEVAGGVYLVGTSSAPASLTVEDSTISGNSAGHGGGVALFGDAPQNMFGFISRSTVAGNTAVYWAGGIEVHQGSLTLANTTVSGNTADSAGAIYVFGDDASTVVALRNATVAYNTSGSDGAVFASSGASVTARNAIVANNTGAASQCGVRDAASIQNLGNNLEFPGTSCGFTSADPRLEPLADNGGEYHTQTHALGAGSAARNAGDNATCAAPPVFGVDQRSVARPQGANCEIGAFEAPANSAPTITALPWVRVGAGGTTGPLPFTIGDAETVADGLKLTASSSNTTLVPNGSIVLGGKGPFRTVTVSPAAGQCGGSAIITVNVLDGGFVSPTTFGVMCLTDNAITTGATPMRRAHVVELRAVIDQIRASLSLPLFPWTDPALDAGVTPIKGIHVSDLRTALLPAFSARGRTPPAYTDPVLTPGATLLKRVHIEEIRDAIVLLMTP